MSISLRGLHPTVRAMGENALFIADYYGVPVQVTSGYRSWEEQTRLRQAWERGENPYPANRPGDSAHNWGLAFDSWVPDEWWPAWNAIREWAGFTIYPTTDKVHGEYPSWRNYVGSWPRPGESGWG